MTKKLGWVSTEGGPLLIGDREALRTWRGSDTQDYDEACELLGDSSAVELAIGGEKALLWDMPTGTATVWHRDDAVIAIVRFWTDDENDEGRDFAEADDDGAERGGVIAINSGTLLVHWSADPADDLPDLEDEPAKAIDFSVGNSALLASVTRGNYAWTTDELAIANRDAIRCLLRAQ